MSQSRSYSDLFRDTVQAGLRDDSIQNVDVVQKRSYSDSSPNNFAEASSPLDEFLQHPKCLVNSSVLDSTVPFSKIRPQSLRRQNSTESTSQISSDGSRPCSSANSRPGSAEYNQTDCSDENAASQRFRDFQSETSDDFGYFFTFKDTLNEYSDRLLSEFKQDNQIQDFPVTFAKIASSTRKTNNSSEQSPERETGTGIWNVQRDMSNLSLTTKMLDEAKEGEMRKEENSAEEQSIFDYDITYDSFKEDITKNDCTIAEANSEQSYASAHDQQQACTSKDLIEISSIINDEKLDEEKLKSPKEPDDTNVEQQPYEKHSCSQLLYCQTCYKRICTECVSSCCRGHVTTNFSKYLRTIELQAEEILDEAYNGIDILTDDMEDVMLDMSTLNKRATEAIASVQFSSHVMLAAVEEREKELFRQITEVRQWKYDALHEKYANLRDDQARLAEAVHALKYVLYEMRSHPSEIMKMKDRVMAEIWQICQNRRTSSRSDQENWISFKGTENNVIPVIANVGSVSARSPGVIGDRKTESFSKFDEMNLQHGPIAFGRPILNYDFNINLANRETNLYVYSTEVTIIGYHGENSDKNLSRPWGVAVDTDGNIIVSDRSNNRIQIYQSDGTLINQFGQYGSGECEFNRPAGITVDAKRRIIVADKDNHRVQILTMQGKFIDAFGRCGDQPGEFNYPWGIATNSACEIAVTDTRNRRIQLFSERGTFLRMFGGKPYDLAKLDSPRDICFNREGNMIVTDFSHHTIVIVNYLMTESRVLDCESRNIIVDRNGEESHESPLLRPQGVMMSDNGHIIVADSRHNAIKVFNSIGTLLFEYKPGLQEMDRPLGMALYTDGRILFTDYNQNYVRLVRLSNHINPERRNNVIGFD